MLESLGDRTDKEGGRVGATMAIFFKTTEPRVPEVGAGGGGSGEKTEVSTLDLDLGLDLGLNNGVRIGRVTNLLGIERLDQINCVIEREGDTGAGGREGPEVEIEVKDCGSQNKGNFFRWLGLTGF